ncbi:dolichol-phosphate mannosyltransferase [Methanomicrobium sp. W14]|uniref:glycosyltransferase n=1 Tax=Methanomicrobium sp. W14 TaxID=2817839 RepID=UPI001AE8DE96|nr:glycosyltransferase family 2 protein [Methanomicrobium sp. W14]MBP2134357.1 dolichol-phosphate mannosyltransferase [Methanomicrobium sp. W14]
MAEYSLTIIIPTFNETDNIENIIEAVFGVMENSGINAEILVVDDDSGDGTVEKVKELQINHSGLHLVVRESDHGLSQSVAEGFGRAKADIIQVIDADFSHPVEMIPKFYRAIKDSGYDVVMGSRYAKGGDIKNWPLKRRIISLGATFFGRILFPEITDPVSGFFSLKKSVLKNAVLKPRGYKILMEVLGKGNWSSFKEIPFVFKDREEGESKLKLGTMADYICQCIDIGLYALYHHETNVWKEWKKVFKFGLVGISGIFVNTGILYALTEYAGFYYLFSSFFAIEASIITNFILNDFWTFEGGQKSRMRQKWRRLISFQVVSVIGVIINMAVLFLLTEYFGLWYIFSNIAGIIVAFLWNFFVNRNLTWKLNIQ